MEQQPQPIIGQRVMAVEANSVWLRTICSQNGLHLSDEQVKALEQYAALLLEWNKKINLVSRRDEENFWTSHILHSLSALFKIYVPHCIKILDLGTGGGLPGIVWKIARPDLSFTLLDSTQKKINVVKDIIEAMSLVDIHAVWGRAEELGRRPEHAAQYDAVVARAVAPLKDLVHWCAPFLRRQQRAENKEEADGNRKRIVTPALIAFKGGNIDEEIGRLAHRTSGGSVSVIELALKGSAQLQDNDKKIVVVEFP